MCGAVSVVGGYLLLSVTKEPVLLLLEYFVVSVSIRRVRRVPLAVALLRVCKRVCCVRVCVRAPAAWKRNDVSCCAVDVNRVGGKSQALPHRLT
jgi:hypothetical protein